MAHYGVLRIPLDEESTDLTPAICDGDGLGGDGATHSLNNRDENEEPIEEKVNLLLLRISITI